MKYSLSFLLIACLLCWGLCCGTVQAEENSVQQLIDKAVQTHQQARTAGFEWTATQGLIDSAKEALLADKTELAMSLASRALKQAENGLKQAQYAEQHWQDYLP